MPDLTRYTAGRRAGGPPGAVRAAVLLLLLAVLSVVLYKLATAVPAEDPPKPTAAAQPSFDSAPTPTLTPEPTETPEPTPTPRQLLAFAPYATEATEPSLLINRQEVNVDGRTLGADEAYEAAEPIDFGYGDEYTDAEGIITFRGNNFRDGGSYGLANLTEYKFGQSWSVGTGTLSYGGETWSGSGWVGQPLIVRWPEKTKAVMNMYDWAKQDDGLVEVIYATMDGNIYFLDLNTGKKTRDTLNMGYTFKGSGALDPRGYPILYVGAGYDSVNGRARAFIVSLIDYEVLHTFGDDDIGGFSLRGALSYFDGSPLVDAETDQLIYPGENGIIYIIKLNTDYDPAAGTLSIAPETVKWRYSGTRTSSKFWVGMEDSPVIWRNRLIVADNGGNLMCLNLNTLTLDWVQDILDDSNGSPVLSLEDDHPYIYISTSFHEGWRSWTTAPVPIFKIDAENGEIVWRTDYECRTESGVSGGVQSTIALGRNALEGRVYVTVARTGGIDNGVLACLDRETGEVLWEHRSSYTWSSPVLVYNADGGGSVIYCNYYGQTMFLLDGLTGEVYDTFNLQGGVEASPAAYENTVVVGTRQCKIWGIRLK